MNWRTFTKKISEINYLRNNSKIASEFIYFGKSELTNVYHYRMMNDYDFILN